MGRQQMQRIDATTAAVPSRRTTRRRMVGVARRSWWLALVTTVAAMAGCSKDVRVAGHDVQADGGGGGDDCAGASCAACAQAPDGATCDDGDACTIGDRCEQGACVGVDAGCECGATAPCVDDGDLCNGVPTCDVSAIPYRCKVAPTSIVHCAADTACTSHACVAATGACATSHAAAGVPCDDGQPCTSEDACDGAGSCKGSDSPCPCAADADCVAGGTNLCEPHARCDPKTHQCALDPTSAVDCGAPTGPCRAWACQPSSGLCVETLLADGTACEDGIACTGADTCAAGSCSGTPSNCPCTKDADCADDGDLCNGVPFCNAATGACATNPATVVVCATVDDTDCHKAQCQPKDGSCAQVDLPDATTCSDGNGCSQGDACEGGSCKAGTNVCGCQEHADCAGQEDGDACNGTLICDATTKTCVVNPATIVDCGAAPGPCLLRTCAAATGACSTGPAPDGTPCNDGEACSADDACQGGGCVGSTLVCPCIQDADCKKFDDDDLCTGILICSKTAKGSACVVDLATTVTCTAPAGEPCLSAGCNPNTGGCYLVAKAEGASCNDGKPCTGGDACKGGSCAGAPLACDDGEPCTQDACVASAGGCVHVPLDCADASPCTSDACVQGACVHAPVKGACDDGDPCTGPDLCAGGACTSQAVDCADEASCTADSCAKGEGCVHLALDATACDDGVGCTVADTCVQGVCKGLPAGSCDDANSCTIDVCQAAVGCLHVLVPLLPCNDGDACTGSDLCGPAGCAGTPVDLATCDDGKACTKDSCDAAIGCVHADVAAGGALVLCDDGDACTTGDRCQQGACVPLQVLPCACKADADCQGKPNVDLCLGVPQCDTTKLPYACTAKPGTAVACDTDGDGPCRTTTCTPKTGTCTVTELANGASCGVQGDPCKGGVCTSGLCIPTGKPLDCDDSNPCTADLCIASKGCQHLGASVDGKPCDDGDACTAVESCQGGTCTTSGPTSCEDGNGCTADSCVSDKGCKHDGAALDGKACDDASACTLGDACAAGSCKAGKTLACDDGAACTVDSCDATKGCQHDALLLAGVPCDDGDACTKGDACGDGACKGAPIDCDDGSSCTVDACAGGVCSHLGATLEGTPCKHAIACVTGTTCKGGVCSGGDAKGCGDTGDCSIQPDALGSVSLVATGRIDAAFGGGGAGRVAVTAADGKVAIGLLDWPFPSPWSPVTTVAGPPSSVPPPAAAVLPMNDGGVLVGGGAAAGSSASPTWSGWLRRVAADGTLIWQSQDAAAVAAPLRDLLALTDGTIGAVASVDPQGRSLVLRLDGKGTVVWSKAEKGGNTANATADRWQLERGVALGGSHGVYLGAVVAPTSANGAAARGLVVRYDPAGGRVYAALTGAAKAGAETRLFDAAPVADGSLRAVGATRAGASAPWRPWAARITSAGSIVNEGELAIAQLDELVLDAIATASDGGFAVAGHGGAVGGARVAVLAHLGAADAPRWTRTWPFDATPGSGHLAPCAGCLAPAGLDGWRLVAAAWTTDVASSEARSLRVGAYGHASCKEAGLCGQLDLSACSDGAACTLDGCDPSTGCSIKLDDALCDDGSSCTADACVAADGCVHTPQSGPCSLAGGCEIAACSDGKCKSTGTLIDCDDKDPCTLDGCTGVAGCTHTKVANNARCLDDALCVQGVCGSGVGCVSATARSCDDLVACTLDACTKGKGCSHTPVDSGPCNDGDACTSGESCKGGTCQGGTTKACASGQVCTAGTCYAATCGGGNMGLTFTVVSRDPILDIMRIVAYPQGYGYPPDSNPYVGEHDCAKALPVLCIRKYGYAAPKPLSNWSGGVMAASQPVAGCGVRTRSQGDKVCSDRFGSGWVWFEWHVTGQETYAHGDIPLGTRGWTFIVDQAKGTCGQ